MPTSVMVGRVRIQQANNYGPDGRAVIMWKLWGDEVVVGEYSGPQLVELLVALRAWREANP